MRLKCGFFLVILSNEAGNGIRNTVGQGKLARPRGSSCCLGDAEGRGGRGMVVRRSGRRSGEGPREGVKGRGGGTRGRLDGCSCPKKWLCQTANQSYNAHTYHTAQLEAVSKD